MFIFLQVDTYYLKMQALMMESDEIEILDPSDLIPVSCELEEYSNRQSHSVPLVELGKQLRLSAQQGDVNNVRLLMGKGAPFTTDWVTYDSELQFVRDLTVIAMGIARSGARGPCPPPYKTPLKSRPTPYDPFNYQSWTRTMKYYN